MLFCNSLSAVVGHDGSALPVISPVTVYRELFPALRSSLDAVVLACAHFKAVLPFVTTACDLPVIDIGSRLAELTIQAVANRTPVGHEHHGWAGPALVSVRAVTSGEIVDDEFGYFLYCAAGIGSPGAGFAFSGGTDVDIDEGVVVSAEFEVAAERAVRLGLADVFFDVDDDGGVAADGAFFPVVAGVVPADMLEVEEFQPVA